MSALYWILKCSSWVFEYFSQFQYSSCINISAIQADTFIKMARMKQCTYSWYRFKSWTRDSIISFLVKYVVVLFYTSLSYFYLADCCVSHRWGVDFLVALYGLGQSTPHDLAFWIEIGLWSIFLSWYQSHMIPIQFIIYTILWPILYYSRSRCSILVIKDMWWMSIFLVSYMVLDNRYRWLRLVTHFSLWTIRLGKAWN